MWTLLIIIGVFVIISDLSKVGVRGVAADFLRFVAGAFVFFGLLIVVMIGFITYQGYNDPYPNLINGKDVWADQCGVNDPTLRANIRASQAIVRKSLQSSRLSRGFIGAQIKDLHRCDKYWHDPENDAPEFALSRID